MSIVKTIHFAVSSEWWGSGIVSTNAPGKSALRISAPPEFGGFEGSFWSPEELLVNAVASDYALTLTTFSQRLGVPVNALEVEAAGHVEGERDGRYCFVLVHLDVSLETEPGNVALAERAAHMAEERCIVGRSLRVPVDVRVAVRERPADLVAA
jgi:organic hydroperoxide reductase OsmC/OhrA